jgi:hypothetical protein
MRLCSLLLGTMLGASMISGGCGSIRKHAPYQAGDEVLNLTLYKQVLELEKTRSLPFGKQDPLPGRQVRWQPWSLSDKMTRHGYIENLADPEGNDLLEISQRVYDLTSGSVPKVQIWTSVEGGMSCEAVYDLPPPNRQNGEPITFDIYCYATSCEGTTTRYPNGRCMEVERVIVGPWDTRTTSNPAKSIEDEILRRMTIPAQSSVMQQLF